MKRSRRSFSEFALLAGLLGLSLGLSTDARGAACCGGGFAAPSILVGDERAQLTASYAVTDVVVDSVDPDGTWWIGDEHQRVRTGRLEGAHLISDRWQAGVTLPWIERTFLGETRRGLGDVATSAGYEYLTDWDYHPWRPKGIGFLQVTWPTGKARAESESGGLDSRGNGFFALGAGTILTKTFKVMDAFSTLEMHRSFEKRVRTSQVDGTLRPGWGGSAVFGAGYNTAFWRFGASLGWFYEDAVKVDGTLPSAGAPERFGTGTLSAAFMPAEDWSTSLTYADQTQFGTPTNTSLGRSLTILLQKKWPR